MTETKQKNFLTYILAVVVSIIASLVLIIAFALCIKWFSIGDKLITPINLVIKLISLTIGMLVLKVNEKGLKHGLIFGALYAALSYLIFCLMLGSFALGWQTIVDILFCSFAGGLLGIIIVNRRK